MIRSAAIRTVLRREHIPYDQEVSNEQVNHPT